MKLRILGVLCLCLWLILSLHQIDAQFTSQPVTWNPNAALVQGVSTFTPNVPNAYYAANLFAGNLPNSYGTNTTDTFTNNFYISFQASEFPGSGYVCAGVQHSATSLAVALCVDGTTSDLNNFATAVVTIAKGSTTPTTTIATGPLVPASANFLNPLELHTLNLMVRAKAMIAAIGAILAMLLAPRHHSGLH